MLEDAGTFYLVKTLAQSVDGEQGALISSDSLADFLVTKQMVDITSLLPLWLSMYGWIIGLQGLKTQNIVGGYQDLFEIVALPEFPTRIAARLKATDVTERAEAQLRQRRHVIQALDLGDRDSDEFLEWWGARPNEPCANRYDKVVLPAMYNRLFGNFVHRITYGKIICEGKVPIHKQLAFPAKTIRWSVEKPTLKRSQEVIWSKEMFNNKFESSVNQPKFWEPFWESIDTPMTAEELQAARDRVNSTLESMMEEDENISAIIAEYPIKDQYSINLSQSTFIECNISGNSDFLEVSCAKKLLENPDLRAEHYERICTDFDERGIDFRTFLLDLFQIKKHDVGWVLNMVTGFHNKYIDEIQYLDYAQKQILSRYMIDIIELFKGLNVRHVDTVVTTQTSCATVSDLNKIIIDKIDSDTRAMNSLKSAKWIELNRATVANKVARMVNLLDILTLSNGMAANQVQANGIIIKDLLKKVVNDKPIESGLPSSLLNFVTSHNLINGTGVSLTRNKAVTLTDVATGKRITPFQNSNTLLTPVNTKIQAIAKPLSQSTPKRDFVRASDLLKPSEAAGTSGSLGSPIREETRSEDAETDTDMKVMPPPKRVVRASKKKPGR